VVVSSSMHLYIQACHRLGSLSLAFHHGDLGSVLGQFMWNL